MSEGLNKVMLLGNVGTDPELKHTQSGQAILRLRLATSERYKDKQGEYQERTEWHTVIMWGKRGEGLSRVLEKGSRIFVEGSLQTRSWETDDGSKRSATEINARNILFAGGRREKQRDPEPRSAPVDDFGEDDIPF